MISLNDELEKILTQNNLTFKKARISDLENIINLFSERINWFKNNNINQWADYLKYHPRSEFIDAINKGEYYIFVKNNEIVAGFNLTKDSKLWKDTKTNALYLYKVITKTNTKNLGNIIFSICINLAKVNKKDFIRLYCVEFNKKLNDIYEKYGFKLKGFVVDNNFKFCLRELKVN